MRLSFFIITFFSLTLLSVNLNGQQAIPVLDFAEFEPQLHLDNDTVYLVNFWATWCVPCIKELPAIEKIAEEFKNDKLKIILVSLDIPNQLNNRLIPFIRKHQVKSKVIVLNDPDFNQWINRVDPNWSGAIPASLIYTKSQRSFYEQSFSYGELETIIKQILNR
jgi:thiol-disulfide isomerase/thioredoxin